MSEYKTIFLNDRELKYILSSSYNTKKIALKINQDGVLKVSKPIFVSQRIIEKFILQKQVWVLKKIDFFKNDCHQMKAGDYKKDKLRARNLVLSRLNYFSRFYDFKVNKIFVRNQKTRWGSCSSQGNLNFNYRILYLPSYLVDYVIAHEICHLFEMNHSADFWKLVEKQIPDYKNRRKELKKFVF